jgi:hypothetical protein
VGPRQTAERLFLKITYVTVLAFPDRDPAFHDGQTRCATDPHPRESLISLTDDPVTSILEDAYAVIAYGSRPFSALVARKLWQAFRARADLAPLLLGAVWQRSPSTTASSLRFTRSRVRLQNVFCGRSRYHRLATAPSPAHPFPSRPREHRRPVPRLENVISQASETSCTALRN